MTEQKISIHKIAEFSGVSVATVSRVMNGNGRFSPATREKVLRVAAAEGYETKISTKKKLLQQEQSIGGIVPNLSNPFFKKLLE
ncbi:LacI family DNA-binding transcriptional regulator [Lactobacillus sp. DCY120]|uniref:LacI family DNA-binding transcriptional regulator n=1 Tax=Bombilactobacillus apium TaxID=2675299 RepID=A0A850R076_9LACO|nr:LacI family DNA-binding transcriptional regulator [Bombilactobacillus apium]NVY96333.1 LacI family DNA-binding transcriptional regulator [Bombilactobacillus apium]